MNKMELTQAVQKECKLTKTAAASVVELVFDAMADALASGGRVEIRGLCSFFVKEYGSYLGRNPRNGEKVKVAPKKLPFFKPGKELRERLNGG